MDGLSAAASGIAVGSIAIQLAESIKKIVEFGKAVQDAPKNIRTLFHDLDVLQSVILQIDQTNRHIGVDGVTETVLQDCQEKISILQMIIRPAILKLNSNKVACQKWSAFKITLKNNEIQSLQRTIEEAKSTLQLVQNNNFLHMFLSSVQTQNKVVASIETLNSVFQKTSTQKVAFETTKMHVHSVEEPCDVACTPGLLVDLNNGTIGGFEQIICPTRQKDPSASSEDSVINTRRSFDFEIRDWRSSHEYNLATPFVRAFAKSRAYKSTIVRSTEVHQTSEFDMRCVLYPNASGKLLGLSRGLIVSARSTSGWQFSIQPFRAVAEDSLIFEFCRKGNLEGVRTLFERREASPWDRDPTGQTPLWVAIKALKLDVAKLLLNEGADPHARTWKDDTEPIWAITSSETIEMDPKLAMIHLLQNYRREDYDQGTILHIIGRSMVGYRPHSDIKMRWSQRCDALLRLVSTLMPMFHPKDPNCAQVVLAAVQFFYEQEALRWILRTTQCPLDGSIDHSTIHEALHRRLLERDFCSMKLIVQKTRNLHFCAKKGYLQAGVQTPTMLAMYDSNMFRLWRQALRELGHNFEKFIRQELEDGLLREEGWTESSLAYLFDVEIPLELHTSPTILGFPRCQRCGQCGTGLAARLTVDLKWRRRLRDIRLLLSHKSSETSIEESPLTPDPEASPEYRMVCSNPCKDDICLALIYDNDSTEEPDIPPYVDPDASTSKEESIVNSSENDLKESCPTNSMPGAFKD